MRNDQLRKTNNEHSLKKFFFVNGKGWGWGGWGGGGEVESVCICVYAFVLLFRCHFTNFPEF